jgi:hypothetical protein
MVAFLGSCYETFVHTNCSVRSNGERSQAAVVSLAIEKKKKSKRVLEMRQELQVDSRWVLHCPSLSSYITSRYVKLLACQIF